MKNLILNLAVLSILLLFQCTIGFGKTGNQNMEQVKSSDEQTMNIVCEPELNPLISNWAMEFVKINPGLDITVSNKGDNNFNKRNLSFLSAESELLNTLNWKMIIGHNVVVPVLNSKNPMIPMIMEQGVTSKKLGGLISGSDQYSWENLINGGGASVVNCYVVNNEFVNSSITKFSNSNQDKVNLIFVSTTEELISAVQGDLYSIGFCQITHILNHEANSFIDGISLLPIDKNMNGRLDNFEKIYDHPQDFLRGVWLGKFPQALCNSIYVACSEIPDHQTQLAFLTWINTKGQNSLQDFGYTELASTEIQSNLNSISFDKDMAVKDQDSFLAQFWPILSILIIVFGLMGLVIYGVREKKSVGVKESTLHMSSSLNENSFRAPKGLFYDKSHTWAFMQQDGNVKVGIDDFLQKITGTITRLNMKEAGQSIRKGENVFSIVRDGKQLNVSSPVSGTILKNNDDLKSASFLVNSAPYNEGWVYVIEPSNWLRETQFMYMAEKYKEWLRHELLRLKDFIVATMQKNNVVYSQIILQDGGELTENVLAELGPEIWEDFQKSFLDVSK